MMKQKLMKWQPIATMTGVAHIKRELFHVHSSKGNMAAPTIIASEQNPTKQNTAKVLSPK